VTAAPAGRERVVTVLGTRPEIIRLSRLIPKLDAMCDHVLVHTGQNQSANLNDVFFRELGVRPPDVFLGVDTSCLGRQLATLFERFETLLDERRPDRVLILGDTNSGLVAFNCARRGTPVFHLEAGNRCYDDRVPEEVNRRVIDHCSTVLLPYTHRSAANLAREGIERHRIFVTGNPIFEVLEHYRAQIDGADGLRAQGVEPRRYLVATMHRAENVDHPAVLERLCQALREVAALYAMPLILSVHPRVERLMTSGAFAGTRVVPVRALPFFEFVQLEKNAAMVLSDSGTVQEECAILRVPVITIRDVTERPETIEAGSNIVASTDPVRILAAARYLLASGTTATWTAPPEYMVPNVSDTVIRILLGKPEWAAQRAFG
jgi:UDP-N-acetylglucosamine 2-epimerase (non-hydrolysing)